MVRAHAVLEIATAGAADEPQERREGKDGRADNVELALNNSLVFQNIVREVKGRAMRRKHLPKTRCVQARRGLL